MKKDWIYQLRGIAIVAVVVCHQQGILHESEVIQLFSLYSVTTLIFLMGVTKAISLHNHYNGNVQKESLLLYSLKSMLPTICAYAIATFIYTYNPKEKLDFNIAWTDILSFSASPPFYFIRYYLLLSLWAPLLFSIIKRHLGKRISKGRKWIQLLIIFILIWLAGYESIGRIDLFGQSYLFVYSLGLLAGQIGEPKARKVHIVPAVLLFFAGLISTKRFYWALVAGIEDYAEGIDFLDPGLQINPPNISIIIYSFGVIWVAYLFFELTKDLIYIRWTGKLCRMIGKYSLDIYLWHLYIQQVLHSYNRMPENRLLKWSIYYGAMLFIPTAGRIIYNRIKKMVYNTLAEPGAIFKIEGK